MDNGNGAMGSFEELSRSSEVETMNPSSATELQCSFSARGVDCCSWPEFLDLHSNPSRTSDTLQAIFKRSST